MMQKNGLSPLKKLLPMMVLGVIALTIGCSDDDDTTQPPAEFAPPSNLAFAHNTSDGRVNLTWTASPDQGLDDFAGYNVYRGTTSMDNFTGPEMDSLEVTEQPVNQTSHSLDATVGVRYFYTVRAVKDNGDLSESADEVDTALPLGGNIITSLAEFVDKSRDSGMDLSEGATYSVVIENLEHIDFFLGTTDDENDQGFELALKSPSLLLGDNEAQWATRQAGFKVLDDPTASTTTTSGFLDSITMTAAEIENKAIVVRLPRDENDEIHYGKLSDFAFKGTAGTRSMTFVWTYQPVSNYIRF